MIFGSLQPFNITHRCNRGGIGGAGASPWARTPSKYAQFAGLISYSCTHFCFVWNALEDTISRKKNSRNFLTNEFTLLQNYSGLTPFLASSFQRVCSSSWASQCTVTYRMRLRFTWWTAVVESRILSVSHLRSASQHYLTVPRYRLSRPTLGRRAFSVAGPATWNSTTQLPWPGAQQCQF